MEQKGKAIRLLKKSKQSILKMIFSRMGLMLILLMIQLFVIVGMIHTFEDTLPYIYAISLMFSSGMVIYMLNTSIDPTAKITWLIVIMLLPIFGVLLFLYVRNDFGHIALKSRINYLINTSKDELAQDEATLLSFKEKNFGAYSLSRYVNKSGCFPIYDNSSVTYFSQGEDKWKAMLEELEKAKHFIFLEYFIIDEGEMWGQVLEVLSRKAKEGVDIRVMYDGTCEFALLPKGYPRRLAELGIKCKVFSPVTPFLSTHYNYRDHRKILVIDGHVAFNGGVNLADEYINLIERFGHWKDTAVMIEGDAAKSFTLMFLQMWNIDVKKPAYKPYVDVDTDSVKCKGYVMPYNDSPLDDYKVGERVYMDILNRSKEYVYIMTPYLILDGELETAIRFASERDVEIKIILPGVPDKKMPYALAKTHYRWLMDSGVKIYEYTPGFVHAKMFICDDCEATVGTINLDYRSLYHHFECGTYMYDVDCITDIKKDFEYTLSKCHLVTREDIKHEKLFNKILGNVAKVISPLL